MQLLAWAPPVLSATPLASSRFGPPGLEVAGPAFRLVRRYHITKFFIGLGKCEASAITPSPHLGFYRSWLTFLWMMLHGTFSKNSWGVMIRHEIPLLLSVSSDTLNRSLSPVIRKSALAALHKER